MLAYAICKLIDSKPVSFYDGFNFSPSTLNTRIYTDPKEVCRLVPNPADLGYTPKLKTRMAVLVFTVLEGESMTGSLVKSLEMR
jgi:hypothetical protein